MINHLLPIHNHPVSAALHTNDGAARLLKQVSCLELSVSRQFTSTSEYVSPSTSRLVSHVSDRGRLNNGKVVPSRLSESSGLTASERRRRRSGSNAHRSDKFRQLRERWRSRSDVVVDFARPLPPPPISDPTILLLRIVVCPEQRVIKI